MKPHKRIYIAGPMTGKPHNNFSAFDSAAAKLREKGYFVINPAELSALFGAMDELELSFTCLYGGKSQVYNLTSDIARAVTEAELAAVRSCDAIYLLPGWEKSRGARQELRAAIENGLEIMLEGE